VDGISFTVHSLVPGSRQIGHVRSRFGSNGHLTWSFFLPGRHGSRDGASMAKRAATLRAAGRLPAVSLSPPLRSLARRNACCRDLARRYLMCLVSGAVAMGSHAAGGTTARGENRGVPDACGAGNDRVGLIGSRRGAVNAWSVWAHDRRACVVD
jgi:hypothetical protein